MLEEHTTLYKKLKKLEPILPALFQNNVLVPLRHLYPIASAETFRKFRQDGLPTRKISGLGVCVYPNDFKKFLDEKSEPE